MKGGPSSLPALPSGAGEAALFSVLGALQCVLGLRPARFSHRFWPMALFCLFATATTAFAWSFSALPFSLLLSGLGGDQRFFFFVVIVFNNYGGFLPGFFFFFFVNFGGGGV